MGVLADEFRQRHDGGSNMPNWAAPGCATPACVDGQTKRPLSRRLANRQNPWLSQYKTFTKSPRRPRNTNRWPENGSFSRTSWTRTASPGIPLRMSARPSARYTRRPVGTVIIVRPAPKPDAPSEPDRFCRRPGQDGRCQARSQPGRRRDRLALRWRNQDRHRLQPCPPARNPPPSGKMARAGTQSRQDAAN